MKIVVLSRNRKLYSTRRLIEAATERGHEVKIVDVLRCYMNIVSRKPSVHFEGESLEGYNAVIPRIGASVTAYGTAVLRQFEVMGTYSLIESVALSRSRDKLRSLQLLSRKGIGLGLSVAGVDLLRSERGPLVMEVNSSPGLEGIEAASGKDVAGIIIEHIEKNARPGNTATRGKG